MVVESVKAVESVFGGEPEEAIGSLGDRKDGEGIRIDVQAMGGSGRGKGEGKSRDEGECAQECSGPILLLILGCELPGWLGEESAG